MKEEEKSKFKDLTVADFLQSIASSEPTPGGGSVSALCGALSASLGQMVTQLTIGKTKYAEVEDPMKESSKILTSFFEMFVEDIDLDAEAFESVILSFQLPKNTDYEKAERDRLIQESFKIAVRTPMQIAQKAHKIMDIISLVAKHGNQSAVTDACVAMLCARTAVLGAILNVRINLSSIKDKEFVEKYKSETDKLEKEAIEKETQLLEWVNSKIQ